MLTAAKEVCRQAFQNQPQRLVTPMYSCNIVVNAEMLGEALISCRIFLIIFKIVFYLTTSKCSLGLNINKLLNLGFF